MQIAPLQRIPAANIMAAVLRRRGFEPLSESQPMKRRSSEAEGPAASAVSDTRLSGMPRVCRIYRIQTFGVMIESHQELCQQTRSKHKKVQTNAYLF